MAIAVHQSRHHVVHRPPWVRQRGDESNAALGLVVVLLLTVGITGTLLAWQVLDVSLPRTLGPSFSSAAPNRPTDGAAPAMKLPLAAPPTAESAVPVDDASAAPAPVVSDPAPPEPPALDVGARARVANTDGLGVVLYAAPRDNARQPAGLLEGTPVTVLEHSVDAWARVQSASKQTGWVRAQYLIPAE
jgi:hypothetical protein